MSKAKKKVKRSSKPRRKAHTAKRKRLPASHRTNRVVTRIKRVAAVRKRKVAGIGSRVKRHITQARELLEMQLGKAEVQRYVSTTRKAYHRANNKAKELKAKLRRLL